jgi:hypothetical protein
MANRPRSLDFKKAEIVITDGSTPANELTVFVGEGTMSFTERRTIEYIRNRGLLDHTREGDEEPLELSINAALESFLSDSGNNDEPITIYEALKRNGNASDWESTGNECEPYAVDIEVRIRQDCGSVLDEVHRYKEFRYEEIGGDYSEATLDISGMCMQNEIDVIRTTLGT